MQRWTPIAAVLIAALALGAGVWWLAARGGADEGVAATTTPTPGETAREGVTPEPGAPTDVDDAPDGVRGSGAVREAVAADELLLEVLLADGSPAAEAAVVVFRGEEILAEGKTDFDGVVYLPAAEFPADGEGLELAVLAWEAPLLHQEFAPRRPRTTVRLARGAEVSGRLEVNGEAPGEEVELFLHTNDEWLVKDSLPEAVREVIDITETWARRTDTAEDGSFRFTGFSEAWGGGRLRVPRELCLLPAEEERNAPDRSRWPERAVPVPGPVRDLVLHTTRTILLRGRVVDPQSSPVPGAEVQVVHREGARETVTGLGYLADGRGRFELAISPWLGDADLDLQVASSTGAGRTTTALPKPRPDARGIWDLGDVRAGGFATVRFLVQDVEERPVGGAVLLCREDTGEVRQWAPFVDRPTDSDGLASIEVDGAGREVVVIAPGHHPETVTLGPRMADPVVITVHPGTELLLVVTSPAGSLPEDLQVEITAEAPPFAGLDTWYLVEGHVTAGRGRYAHGNTGPGRARLHLDAEGRVELSGLRTGIPLTVEVKDGARRTLVKEMIPALRDGERREIALEIPGTTRTLRGVVVDAAGRPVAGAEITLFPPEESRGTEREAGPDGRFAIGGVLPERGRLLVTAEHHAPLVDSEFVLPPEGTEVELRLEAPRRIRVEVVDEAGDPAPGGRLEVTIAGLDPGFEILREDPGVFEVEGLPAGRVVFELRYGGWFFSLEHDTNDPVANFVVPRAVPVTLQIEIDTPLDPGLGFPLLRIVNGEQASHGFGRALDGRTDPPWTIRFPALIPGEFEAVLLLGVSEEGVPEEAGPVSFVVPRSGGEVEITLRF